MKAVILNHGDSLSNAPFGRSFADLPELIRPSVLAPAINTTQQRLAHDRVKGCGIKFVRWGRSIYYRKSDVIEFFESRVRTSTQSAAA
jgi:hypothetical protein